MRQMLKTGIALVFGLSGSTQAQDSTTKCWTQAEIRSGFEIRDVSSFSVRPMRDLQGSSECKFHIEAVYPMAGEHYKVGDPTTTGVSRFEAIYEKGSPIRYTAVYHSDGEELGGCSDPICIFDAKGAVTTEGLKEGSDAQARRDPAARTSPLPLPNGRATGLHSASNAPESVVWVLGIGAVMLVAFAVTARPVRKSIRGATAVIGCLLAAAAVGLVSGGGRSRRSDASVNHAAHNYTGGGESGVNEATADSMALASRVVDQLELNGLINHAKAEEMRRQIRNYPTDRGVNEAMVAMCAGASNDPACTAWRYRGGRQ